MFRVARIAPVSRAWARSLSRFHQNDQIYVHEAENGFKFTLLPDSAALPIGHCLSKHNVTPDTFRPNPAFVDVLNKTIGQKVHDDFAFIVEAGANALTFMPIYDFREIPRYGRIPEIDNIYGYVQVDSSGKIVPGTYEANNMYRLCNGVGLVRLSDYLYEQVGAATRK